jgi:hypothetical protein
VVERVEALPAFTDPDGVNEIYVEEIGDIQIVGGVMKVTLVVSRDLGSGPELIARVRLAAPLASVPRGLKQVIAAFLGHPFMSSFPEQFGPSH